MGVALTITDVAHHTADALWTVVDKLPAVPLAVAAFTLPVWLEPVRELSEFAGAIAPLLAVGLLIVKLLREARRDPEKAAEHALEEARASKGATAAVLSLVGFAALARLFKRPAPAVTDGWTTTTVAPGVTVVRETAAEPVQATLPLDPPKVAPARLTAASEPRWLTLARSHMGMHEGAGAADNPAVLRLYARVGHPEVKHDATPWCAAFVGGMLADAGEGFMPTLSARDYMKWGQPLAAPRLGCVVVLWRDSRESYKGHVGFFVGRRAGKVLLLGGNQGDRVSIAEFPEERVLGYRWPKGAMQSRTVLGVASLMAVSVPMFTFDAMSAAGTLSGFGQQFDSLGDSWAPARTVAHLCQIASAALILYARIDDWRTRGR